MSSRHQPGNQPPVVQFRKLKSKKRKLMLTPPPDSCCESLSSDPLTRHALRGFNRTTGQIITPPPSIDGLEESDINPEQLRLIASHGGPDLRDIRGYSELVNGVHDKRMARGQEDATNQQQDNYAPSIATKASSACRADYQMKLVDSLICPYHAHYPRAATENRKELTAVINRSLKISSPSLGIDDEHQARFIEKTEASLTEADWMRDAFPYIAGETTILHTSEVVFNNLAAITMKKVTQAKPDYYEGSHPTDLKGEIREHLGKYIIPSTHLDRPMLPNFILEAKGFQGNGAEAGLQACHGGALGARAIHQLRSYGKDPETMYDNKAYTITATYSYGLLVIHAHHPTSSDGYGPATTVAKRSTAYHMTRIGAWGMIGDLDSYRKAITAFRNIRIWAKEKRDEFIAEANKVSEPYIASNDFSDEDDEEGEEEEREEEEREEEEREEEDEGGEDEEEEDSDGLPQQPSSTGLHPAVDPLSQEKSHDISSIKRQHSTSSPSEHDPETQLSDQYHDDLGNTPPKPKGKRPRND